MPLAPVDGVKLFGVEVGSGLPCLVMHGGLGVDDTQFREAHDPLGDVLGLVYSAVRRGDAGDGVELGERLGVRPGERLDLAIACGDGAAEELDVAQEVIEQEAVVGRDAPG